MTPQDLQTLAIGARIVSRATKVHYIVVANDCIHPPTAINVALIIDPTNWELPQPTPPTKEYLADMARAINKASYIIGQANATGNSVIDSNLRNACSALANATNELVKTQL